MLGFINSYERLEASSTYFMSQITEIFSSRGNLGDFPSGDEAITFAVMQTA